MLHFISKSNVCTSKLILCDRRLRSMSYGVIQKSNKILHLLNFISQLNNELDFYYFLGFVIYPIDRVIKLVSMRNWTKYASIHTKIAFVFSQIWIWLYWKIHIEQLLICNSWNDLSINPISMKSYSIYGNRYMHIYWPNFICSCCYLIVLQKAIFAMQLNLILIILITECHHAIICILQKAIHFSILTGGISLQMQLIKLMMIPCQVLSYEKSSTNIFDGIHNLIW